MVSVQFAHFMFRLQTTSFHAWQPCRCSLRIFTLFPYYQCTFNKKRHSRLILGYRLLMAWLQSHLSLNQVGMGKLKGSELSALIVLKLFMEC